MNMITNLDDFHTKFINGYNNCSSHCRLFVRKKKNTMIIINSEGTNFNIIDVFKCVNFITGWLTLAVI